MSNEELQISINKPAGVAVSAEMAAALENLAEIMAIEAEDEVAGFQWKSDQQSPKPGGLPEIGRIGDIGFSKPEQNLTICSGGYQDGACGGWFLDW